jgi:flavin-binding protein dodecin
MRIKLMDYRHKYMTLQIQARTADPIEYHQAITQAITQAGGTGGTVLGEVTREQLWARVQAQEGQVTKMHDHNYQLKLRMEQVNEIKGHQDARRQLPAETQDGAGK